MRKTYFKPKRKNKYGAVKQTYNGFSYDSKFESEYAMELDWRLKAKDIKSWERQKTIELRVHDKKICTYKIDFIIHHHDGTKEYVECKGFETAVWRLKWKLFIAIFEKEHPDIKITLVKYTWTKK